MHLKEWKVLICHQSTMKRKIPNSLKCLFQKWSETLWSRNSRTPRLLRKSWPRRLRWLKVNSFKRCISKCLQQIMFTGLSGTLSIFWSLTSSRTLGFKFVKQSLNQSSYSSLLLLIYLEGSECLYWEEVTRTIISRSESFCSVDIKSSSRSHLWYTRELFSHPCSVFLIPVCTYLEVMMERQISMLVSAIQLQKMCGGRFHQWTWTGMEVVLLHLTKSFSYSAVTIKKWDRLTRLNDTRLNMINGLCSSLSFGNQFMIRYHLTLEVHEPLSLEVL